MSSEVSSSSINSIKSSLFTAEQSIEKGLAELLKNKYVKPLLTVLLLAYLPIAAPSIGSAMVGVLNNYAVKFVYIFLLAYILSNSVKASLLTSVVIVIGILVIKKMSSENFESVSQGHKKKNLLAALLNNVQSAQKINTSAVQEAVHSHEGSSDDSTCQTRSRDSVTGYDENTSEYSDIDLSNKDLNNC